MNLSPLWADLLRGKRIAALHWSSLGAAHTPDPEIMDYAAEHGDVVLTRDLDFGIMLALTRSGKPSVVQIRLEQAGPEIFGARVVSLLRELDSELNEGALVTVDKERTRVRLLPLQRN